MGPVEESLGLPHVGTFSRVLGATNADAPHCIRWVACVLTERVYSDWFGTGYATIAQSVRVT